MGVGRSVLFNIVLTTWTATLAVLFLPLLPLPGHHMRRAGAWWSGTVLALSRALIGIGYEIRGKDNIPDGPVIFAAKHQSAWDTMFFPAVLGDPAMVAKRELRWIPFYGWFAWRAGQVWLDRRAGGAALRILIRGALDAIQEGRAVVIFPQGTRTTPGTPRPYQPGVAALYAGTGAAIVPVALNSGLFWGRRAFFKRPGTITVEFLPPVARGLRRDDFLDALSDAIETTTRRLEVEAHSAVPRTTP